MLRLRRGVVVVASLAAIALGQSMAAGVPVALAAGTLYVDRNVPTCSDTGSGTLSVPYCTIGAAAAVATAGTSVVVNSSGTYPEEVKVMHSGTQGAPITFAPASGASVTISGQTHGFTVTNRSWITISGFNITNTSNYGIYLDTSADIIVDSNQVSFTGKPASGLTAAGIHLTATTDSLIENNTIHDTTWAGIELYSGSVRVEVRHNVISKSAAKWVSAAVGIDVESASATVDYNVTHDNEDSGIQFYTGGNNGIAFDNVSYNNGDHGIDNFNVTGGVLTGNVIYHNCTSGINVEGTSGNYTIENNIAVDNAYTGNPCNRGTGNIRIADSAPATTTADYNLVNLGSRLYFWAGNAYSSIDALHTATGQEAHGKAADPMWVNPAGGDFHLQAGSPAIDSANAGAPGEPSVDIEGKPRVDDPATPNTGAGPRAYDDRGAYEFQPTLSDTTPPTVPGGLAATSSTSKPLQVNLSWNPSTDDVAVMGYTVYRGGMVLKEVSGTSYTDAAVADGTKYTYTVDAFDTSGNHSAQSGPVTVTTPDLTPPSVPTGLNAVGSTMPLQVQLSWNASTDNVGVTGYTVYRNGAMLITVSGSTLTYTDAAVSQGTTYSYTADAFDAAGNHSAQTAPPVSVNMSDVTPPSVPTNLIATFSSGPARVNLSWNASSDNVGVTGYTIYRDGTPLNTVSGSTLAYVDTTVTGGTTYSYTVDAFDAAGNHSAQSGPVVVGWNSLGGVLSSQPAVSSWGASRSDVFVRGSDNQLWHKSWNGTTWSAWEPLGGVLTSGPSAVSWGPNRIDVFVRGTDNQLWHKWFDSGVWYGWEPLGGQLTSSPATASWSAGRLDVFVRGTDNQLWHKWLVAGVWYGWEPQGGILTADPAAVSWSSNRIDVFVRGTDNGLWQKSWDGTRWNFWQLLGGTMTSGPAASSCTSGHLDVFATGAGGALMQMGFNSTWSTWQNLGGQWTSSPGAVCQPGTTSVNLLERGTDNALRQTNLAGT